MASLTRWHLLRHAPIAPPWQGRIIGRTDADAELPADPQPRPPRWPSNATWIVTPLQRTQQTALWLGAEANRWHVVPELAEQDHGDWEGGRWTELLSQDPEARAYFEAYDVRRPPQGESLREVQIRCVEAFERLSRDFAGRDLVAVLHAGPIRCILAHALSFPLSSALKLSIEPLSLTRLTGTHGSWQVEGVNVPLGRP
ncbi:bifunctional RNase H/acid phosphatase [compost metagenome]